MFDSTFLTLSNQKQNLRKYCLLEDHFQYTENNPRFFKTTDSNHVIFRNVVAIMSYSNISNIPSEITGIPIESLLLLQVVALLYMETLLGPKNTFNLSSYFHFENYIYLRYFGKKCLMQNYGLE